MKAKKAITQTDSYPTTHLQATELARGSYRLLYVNLTLCFFIPILAKIFLKHAEARDVPSLPR